MPALMKDFMCIWCLLHLRAIINCLDFSWILIIRIIILIKCLLMYCTIREQLQRDMDCSFNVCYISIATDYCTVKTVTYFLYLLSTITAMSFILLMVALPIWPSLNDTLKRTRKMKLLWTWPFRNGGNKASHILFVSFLG